MTRSVLELTYQLSDLADQAAYLAGARTELQRFFGCDDTFWMETDYVRGTCDARHGRGTLDPSSGT